MPTIRVSAETMQRLERWADPLEDTAESAISKALDAAEKVAKEPHTTPQRDRSQDKCESFIDHLLAIPNVGNDADFERDRSGPQAQQTTK